MKTNLCDTFIEDIAADAVGVTALSAEAAAHLRACAACREKLVVLKRAAEIQNAAAALLPEPKRQLSSRQLARALENEVEQRRGLVISRRPIFACAVVLALITAALFVRKPQESAEPQPLARKVQTETQPKPEAFEPTMSALRHEMQGGGEQMFAAVRTGAGMRHYRVRDVESELQN